MFLDGLVPSPDWLNAGDTGWQLTAATLVGLQSVPGLAILYAGLMKRKWALNSALMVLYAFAMTLLIWTLWSYNMGFGQSAKLFGQDIIGMPSPVNFAQSELQQATIPLLTSSGSLPPLRFPLSAMVYFQFVFGAITVIILGGALLGRMNFKAWMLFVPLWMTVVYPVGAFLIWGGGWLAQGPFGLPGAVDYSGGYVIHVAAGISGVVAAAVVGPRLLKDRQENNPSNLLMAIAGGGLLWLGWNGFNGGDPYTANADAAAAVLNTNLSTATALIVWMLLDVFMTGKSNVAGMVNGMIAGLVAITPGAGWVNGFGAIIIGAVAAVIPWFTMQYLPRVNFFKKIDDTLGVMHTHLFPGAIGGLMVGLIADPAMVIYPGSGKTADSAVTGLFYGNPKQFLAQAIALAVIVVYDFAATFVVIRLVGFLVPLRMPHAHLEVGDEMVHGDVSLDLGVPKLGVEPPSVPVTHYDPPGGALPQPTG
ncbi:MAG TPA: ammonium transporter [Candidatus Dormibacteraeota bacterium]|nr:ammonium transporter [Candidatus Dormibacteraeota bacterium]